MPEVFDFAGDVLRRQAHRERGACVLRERRLREAAQQPHEQPMPVHGGMPVVAAVERRRQLARRSRVGIALRRARSCWDIPGAGRSARAVRSGPRQPRRAHPATPRLRMRRLRSRSRRACAEHADRKPSTHGDHSWFGQHSRTRAYASRFGPTSRRVTALVRSTRANDRPWVVSGQCCVGAINTQQRPLPAKSGHPKATQAGYVSSSHRIGNCGATRRAFHRETK